MLHKHAGSSKTAAVVGVLPYFVGFFLTAAVKVNTGRRRPAPRLHRLTSQ
jgi:hypothetical protein